MLEDWELDTEENSSEPFKIPIFNFQISRVARFKSIDLNQESIPSDNEAISDTSSLNFPTLSFYKQASIKIPLPIYIYNLHYLVFRGDLDSIKELWEDSKIEFKTCVNILDIRGNTPLMLSVKLVKNGKRYLKIFRFLLGHGADPHIKDKLGWTAIDEAVCQKNKMIVLWLFEYFHNEKMQKWLNNKHLAVKALKKLPDFYMEMRWEFDSNVIPLVSRIAPHDICKFWKLGNSFRIDTTLVGWKNLRSKRRHMSLYFIPEGKNTNLDKEIFLVNHSKKTIVHPFEPLDLEEKSAVVGDIISTEPMQGNVNLLSYKVKPCLNWRKKTVSQKIGPWETSKHKVHYKGQMLYKKKIAKYATCTECEYFGKDVFDPIIVDLSHSAIGESTRVVVKNSKAFVWISPNFPFTLQGFLPVLQLIGESNPAIHKLHSFLSSEELINSIGIGTFPVKVEIPITMTVKASVTFEKFQDLENNEALKLPEYRNESRKIAQKILTCPKKRLFLANFVV